MGFFKFIALLIASLFLIGAAIAQDADSSQKSQVMMVLDGSNSMWGRVDGQPKISIAKKLMTDLIEGWDDTSHMGLMVYGHRRKKDCTDIEVVAMPGKVNRGYLIDKIQSISPRGKTPITESLLLAAVSVGYFKGRNSVVLVSDGIETCKADPCAQARSLEAVNPDFAVHVIGFDVTEEEFKRLQCIATETGGKFFRASNANELQNALKKTVAAVNTPALVAAPVPDAKTSEPEPSMILFAKLCETCDEQAGNYRWTVKDGDKVLHDGLSDIYPDAPQIAPGTYDVEVQYKSSPLKRTGQLTIGPDGRQTEAFDLNGGSARLDAYATEDKAFAAQPIHYQFYPIVNGTAQQKAIASSAISNEDTWLPAGRYKVTADHKGLTSSTEIEVVAGRTTEYSFDLRFGSVRPRVSLYTGGKVTGSQMQFAIFKRKETAEKATGNSGAVATAQGGLNGFIPVKPGDYFLRITYFPGLGGITRILPITITPGMKQDLPVSLEAAPFTYQIKKAGGFSGFWLTMFRVDESGKPIKKVGNAVNSKYRGVAEPGRYVFEVTTHGKKVVTAPFELKTGQVSELNITLP